MSGRVLVVWCPDWPTTAAGVEAATAGAVVAGGRVAACTAAARADGVRRGQALRDAQRRCPGLVVRERDADAEGRVFETVVAAVAELTPKVEVVRPGLLAVPARGAARFYGSEEALRVLLQDAVVEAGYDCGSGVADGLFAAELAARAGNGGVVVPAGGAAAFLAPYPATVLDRPELAELLWRLGVRTLGAFAALPAGRVAARFGADGALAHRLARGEEPRPLAAVAGAGDLAARTAFDPPAERADQVVFAAKRLADELHAGLAGAGAACVRLEVAVGFADGRESRRLWRHDGRLSALAVADRVRWQLSAWRPTDDGDDGAVWGGVVRLELVPDQLVRDSGRQEALWGRVTDPVARAADRVQALLGHRAITRPVLTGGRGPGEQVVRVPVGDLAPDEPDGPWPGRLAAPAPAVVPAEPVPARLVDAAGGDVVVSARLAVSAPPAALVQGDAMERVVAWAGPWPADERWWDPDRARRRARFQLLTEEGTAYLITVEGGRWHVEAAYD